MRRLPLIAGFLLLLTLLISACGSLESFNTTSPSSSGYSVDPIFRDTYTYLEDVGSIYGEHPFGPAITTAYTQDGLKKQFFRNVQLVYNPSASPEQRYSLAPLGRDIGYYEPPGIIVPSPGDLVVDGYVIYGTFTQLYQQLGPQLVGKPLTGPRLNPNSNRIEQHFENIGFFVQVEDPNQFVRLLHYGMASCGPPCIAQFAPIDGAVNGTDGIGEPFATAVTRLTTAMLGNFVAGPYQGADGRMEVIFENAVLFAEGTHVFARPITLLLNIEPSAPVPQLDTPFVTFFPTEGSLGHNVPLFLDEYIRNHGGVEISGSPIDEFSKIKPNVYRQCFTNICLNYYSDAPAVFQILPVPLGTEYQDRFFSNLNKPAGIEEDVEQYSIVIKVNEAKTLISSQESQIIYASVFINNVPTENVQLNLTVTLPDNSTATQIMPLTNAQGSTSISIESINAINGTLVPYNVCFDHAKLGQICVAESFLIWFNPQ